MASKLRLLTSTTAICFLSACGGGGGGVSSIPTPTPTPSSGTPSPTPTPAAPVDLANASAHANASYDLVGNKVLSSDSSQGALQVRYDGATQTYALTSGARSFTFGPADIHLVPIGGETRYIHTNADGTSEHLTLATKPYSGSRSNSYVALGYWESIQIGNGEQDSKLDIFAYGSKTAATAVPSSGAAGYDIDALAMVAVPGQEPKALQGGGTFNVDFLSGTFLAQAYVNEYGLGDSSTYGSGGNIILRAAGRLGSGNIFSGNVSYTGFLAANPGVSFSNVSGTIQGSFFGPNAEELGASFVADNLDGAHVAGALTGQRNTTQPTTLAVSNLLANTTFDARMSEISVLFDTTTTPFFRQTDGGVQDGFTAPRQVTLNLDGSLSVRGTTLSTGVPKATFTSANQSGVQRPNFTSYDTNQATLYDSYSDSGTVVGSAHFDAYKIGKANPELQLTYVSFGIWSADSLGKDPVYTHTTTRATIYDYLLYGTETPKYLLSGRTGSASYQGVVYGNTVTSDGTLQDVGGASHFNVDFGAQSFSGSLDLTVGAVGGAKSMLGTWTFSDHMVDGQLVLTSLSPNISNIGLGDNNISPRFYGPNGEEIGATFSIVRSLTPLSYPGTYSKVLVTGVTVAKKQ